jgi:hypothetical protein
MIWLTARAAWPRDSVTRLAAAGLLAVSPVLILYGQEARMYSLVTLLGITSVYLAMRLVVRPGIGVFLGFVLINWLMLGFHYYTALLISVEGVYIFVVALRRRRSPALVLVALVASLVPLILWAGLAPAFRGTLAVVSRQAAWTRLRLAPVLEGVWKDLSFGSVRWQPVLARVGYLLLPVFLLGAYSALRPDPIQRQAAPGRPNWGPLFVLIVVAPILASLAYSGGIATRYILWVSPFVYLLVALGISYLWHLGRWWGLLAMVTAGLVAAVGLYHYFVDYQKSEYREMSAYLISRAAPEDAIILEAPRQHLLTKYYLPAFGAIYPMPAVELPEYWPVTAPPIAPEEADHQLREILEKHRNAWLILAGEDEVDGGEFVQRYLTAVSYPQDCQAWLDVRLCEFLNPDDVPVSSSIPLKVAFEGGMELREVQIGLSQPGSDPRYIYVSPQWHAAAKPGADLKVTLRLLSSDGTVVSQNDGLPIGPLLPPTTWNSGDDKPGYMVLRIPETAAPAEYDIAVGMYDPTSLQLVPFTGERERVTDLVKLATVEIDSAGGLSVVQ